MKSNLKTCISYFKPHKRLFYLDMLCALMIGIIDLSFPAVSRKCMYIFIPNNSWKAFWSIMLIVSIAYIIRSVFTYIIWYWGHNFGILVETDMRRDLFKHIQELDFDYLNNTQTGTLLSRLTTDLFDITEFVHHGPEDILVSCVTIIGAIIIMFTIQWRLALIIAVTIPIFLIVTLHYKKYVGSVSRKIKSALSSINTDFECRLSGIKTAKSFANENIELLKFNCSNDKYKNSKYDYHKAMGKFNSFMEFFMCILSVIVISAGGAYIMMGKLNVVDLITFSLYVTTFVSPIRRLMVTSELIANGTAGLHNFMQIMNLQPAVQNKENAVNLDNPTGRIKIDNISFSYNKEKEILHNISLNITKGKTIALVGSSGSGKTTLSHLIPRFYDVCKGRILIDDIDVRNISQKSLHKSIGIVSQDIFLFTGSVKDNIGYGNPNASMEDIIKAAKMAEIYDDILNMPNGFDTNIGERGTLLSGGQKQRIAIARIFLKNPPILILDEATSALDTVTETKIQNTFDKLSAGRTTIVIAHRLSTVKNADAIAVIEHGEICEFGSHKELMSKNGSYAAFVHSQAI